MPDVKWTAKGPALIAAVILFVAGLFVSRSKWRYAALGAILLFTSAGGFFYYSLTIKEWCKVVNESSPFSAAFSPSLRGCLQYKGWLEF
jgi:hypothetical protein